MTTIFNVQVTQEGDWFLVEVDGIGTTQAEHPENIGEMARDLITTMTGSAEPVDLIIDMDLGEHVISTWATDAEYRAFEKAAQLNDKGVEEWVHDVSVAACGPASTNEGWPRPRLVASPNPTADRGGYQ